MITTKLYEYESTLTEKRKKEMGIVYTPQNIIHHINKRCLDLWKEDYPPKVIDFSSGTGVFLVDMCEKISERYGLSIEEVYEKYIFANDIDTEATDIFREYTKCNNISNEDGLTIDLSDYDILIGNPPYIKIQNLSQEGKSNIRKYSWCSEGNSDIYIAMAQRFITSGKIFGFICPNSWQRSSTGSKMVKHVLESKLVSSFTDFRTKLVFNVGAYCSILIGDNTEKNSYEFSNDLDQTVEIKSYSDVDKDNFYLFDEEAEFIKSNNEKETFLLDICSLKVGLATLSDKLYFLPDCTEDGDFYVSGDVTIEKDITKKCYKAGKLSRYDKHHEDRIIFPYDDSLNAYTEEEIRTKFPKANEYFKQIKSKLLKRDNGKFKTRVENGKNQWFEYGRSQGLKLDDEKILMSPIVSKKYFMKIQNGLFISGYCFIPKQGIDVQTIIDAIDCDDFRKWITLFGSPKQGGYYSISTKAISGYKF